MKPLKTCRCDQLFTFHTRHHLCRPRVALAGTRQLYSKGPGSIHAPRTEKITGCEVGDKANGLRGRIRVGDRNKDGNGNVNVDGEGDGAGTTTGVEANERAQDGNENGKRGTGPGRVVERRVCARKPKRVFHIRWKTGETWAERRKNKTRKYSFSSCRLEQYKE